MAHTIKETYNHILEQLEQHKFLSTPQNNDLLNKFLTAKINGGYGRIVYDKPIGIKTAVKKARNLKRVDEYLNQNVLDLTEDNVLKLRDDLNEDNIIAYRNIVKWKGKGRNKKAFTQLVKTKKSLSFRTKIDYKVNFIEFYKFVTEYVYQMQNKRELPDITKFFKLRRPTDYKEVKVEFMTEQEVIDLLKYIKNPDFKALIQLSLVSGARPCEILKVKYGEHLYKNKEGKWIIHLPRVKGVSYKKWPIEIYNFEEDLYPYFNRLKLKKGELLFTTTEKSFRKLMAHYTEKVLGKKYSPKILRKTTRKLLGNAGFKDDAINKIMGHSPDNKVQSHYTNYEGIDIDTKAKDNLKSQMYPTHQEEINKLKLQLKGEKEARKELETKFETEIKPLTELLDLVYKDKLIKKRLEQTVK